MGKLQKIAEHIWTLEYPLQLFGLKLGRRVTILETKPGQLFIHSTGPFTIDESAAIYDLGNVNFIIEATTLHDTFSKEGQAAFPETPYLVPEHFPAKRMGEQARFISVSSTLLADHLQVQKLMGMQFINEYAMYHPQTKSLLLGDVLLNLEDATGYSKFAFKYTAGVKTWPAIDRPFKMSIKNKQDFQKSLQTIYQWDFERIIMAHGHIIHNNAKEEFFNAAVRAGFSLD